MISLLREEGYALGVTNPLPDAAPGLVQDAGMPFELKRIMVSGGMGIGRFAARLEGSDVQ